MEPNPETMERVTAAKAIKAFSQGRSVLALCPVDGEPSWELVASIALRRRRPMEAGVTYYTVTFANGGVRVFNSAGVFWVERASDA